MIARRLPSTVVQLLVAIEALVRLILTTVRVGIVIGAFFFAIEIISGHAGGVVELVVSVALFAGFYVLFSPGLWATHLFIPRGMWRSAWLCTRLGATPLADSHGQLALISAGRAACRSKNRVAACEYIGSALRRVKMLDGGSLAAGATLALAHGRIEQARRLFSMVFELDPKATAKPVERLAREWLVLDAAERGDWDRCLELATTGRRTRVVWFVAALAAIATGRRAFLPELRWLLAPNRRAGLRILERVRAHRERLERRQAEPAEAPALEEPTSASAALRQYVEVMAGENIDADSVLATIAGAEVLRADVELRDRARARSRALGIEDQADAVVQELEREVRADLAELVRDEELPLDRVRATGEVGAHVAAALRDALMSDVESAFDALADRVEADRKLPPVDELAEWAAIAESYRAAIARGSDVRQLLWPHVHSIGCDYAVWLHRSYRHRVTGNAVFRFLLAEARELGDISAIELQEHNVDVGW